MLYRFDIEIDEKEYYDFNIYHMFFSPAGKRSLLRSRLIVPIIFSILLVLFAFRSGVGDGTVMLAVIYSAISLAWFFGVKPLERLLLKMRLRSMKKKEKLPFSKKFTLEFYDDRFVELTDDSVSESKYSVLYRIVENTDKAVYIYRNAIVANIIPTRCFETDEMKKDFIAFIEQKITAEKEKEQ